LYFWCRIIAKYAAILHQKHRVSVRPSGRRGRRVSVHRVDSRHGHREELQRGHNWDRVDVRVGRAPRTHRQCTRPNDHHVDDVDDHHARNPDDRHGELRRDRNQDHGHVGVRASQRNYATSKVTLSESCLVIRASVFFPMHYAAEAQAQRRSDSAP